MLLWLFKQLARGNYRDWLLIETPRLAKLWLWVREADQSASQSPDATTAPNPPAPTSPHLAPSLPLLNMLAINTQTRSIDAQRNKCILAHKLTRSIGSLCTRLDQWSKGWSFKSKKKSRSVKWRRGTCLQLSYLHVQPHVRSLGPGACIWGVMRRGPRRGDKRKSDGGQTAASLAALTDLTHHPPPPPPPPTGCPGHHLFAQGDK